MRQKGVLADGLTIVIITFAVIIIVLFGYAIFAGMKAAVQAAVPGVNPAVFTAPENSLKFMDTVVLLFVFIGMIGGGALLSNTIRTNPNYGYLMIFILIVVGILAAQASNALETFTQTSFISNIMGNFPFISLIIGNFVSIVVAGILIIGAALYFKDRGMI